MGSHGEPEMLTRHFLLLAVISYCRCEELGGTEGYSQDLLYQYQQAQLAEADRTDPGLVDFAVNIPVMLMAFLSALVGGILAPIITEGFRAVRNFQIPEIEFPKLKRKDNRYKYEDLARSFAGDGASLSVLLIDELETLLAKVADSPELL